MIMSKFRRDDSITIDPGTPDKFPTYKWLQKIE